MSETESIREYAVTICTAAVFAAIVMNFIPSGKFEKPMRLLIAAFAMLAIILPLKNIGSGLPEVYSGLDTNMDYTEKAEQIISGRTADQLRQLLKQRGFEIEGVETDAKIGAETGIYVQSVRIYITEKEKGRARELKALVQEEDGIIPEIYVDGEEFDEVFNQ